MNNSFNYSGFSDLVKSSGKKLEVPGCCDAEDAVKERYASQKNASTEGAAASMFLMADG